MGAWVESLSRRTKGEQCKGPEARVLTQRTPAGDLPKGGGWRVGAPAAFRAVLSRPAPAGLWAMPAKGQGGSLGRGACLAAGPDQERWPGQDGVAVGALWRSGPGELCGSKSLKRMRWGRLLQCRPGGGWRE